MSVLINRIGNFLDMNEKELRLAQMEPKAFEEKLLEETGFLDFLTANHIRLYSKGRIDLNGEIIGCTKSKEGRYTCHILNETPVAMPSTGPEYDTFKRFIVFKRVTFRQLVRI